MSAAIHLSFRCCDRNLYVRADEATLAELARDALYELLADRLGSVSVFRVADNSVGLRLSDAREAEPFVRDWAAKRLPLHTPKTPAEEEG